MTKFCNTSRTCYLRLITGSFAKNLMTHREVTNQFLMLMSQSVGVISGTCQWNTEETLLAWLNDQKGKTQVEQQDDLTIDIVKS